MRGDPRLIDDLSRLASGAFGTLNTMRSEAQEQLRSRVRRVLGGIDDETLREEVAAALELAANARAEQEKLLERLQALEERVAQLEAARAPSRRAPKSDLDGKQLA
jgi:BMFP domain-containing protein YqiC